MADLVAWCVSNGEESDLVFAETEADVERMTQTTGDIERAPEFDKYAPGPVPTSALLDAGWWCPCDYLDCGHRVRKYGCDDCDEQNEQTADVVIVGEAVYCSEGCRKAEVERLADLRRVKEECRERSAAYVAKTWPGAVIERNHPDADGLGQVSMRVPGCKGTVEWFESAPGHVNVQHRDIEAWRTFAKKCKENRNG